MLFVRLIILLLFLLLGSVVSIPAVQPGQVKGHGGLPSHSINDLILVLHSYHPGLSSTDSLMHGIQEVLLQAPVPPSFQVEYMDTKRHPDSEYFNHVLDAILHYKLQGRSFDLLIVSGNEALEFALDHRQELFVDTPIVFCAIESFPEELLADQQNITGVVQEPDYQSVFELARKLHPKATRGIVLGRTTGLSDQLVHEKVIQVANNFDQLEFEFWTDYDHDIMPAKLKQLGEGDLIFIDGLFTDPNGNPPCLLKTESLNVPIYSPLEEYFGSGTIGGLLTNDREQGRHAGRLAMQVLSGEDPDNLPVIKAQQSTFRFDSLLLKHFGISENVLPFGAQFINRPQNTYPLTRNQLYVILSLLLFSGVITVFVSRNCLKRVKAERLYRQLSEQFQVILTGIPDNLALISHDMRVIWSNKEEANNNQKFGSKPGEYCCQHFHNRLDFCEDCPVADCLVTGKAEEKTIRSPAGQIFEVKAFPIKDPEGKSFNAILLASDVTEKNRLRDEAIRTSRLASLGELAAGVAHEINNPNALIQLNAELLQKSFDSAMPILQQHYEKQGDFAMGGLRFSELREEFPGLFRELLEGTGRIKRIVNDLKDFTRKGSAEFDDVIDLNELVQASIRLLKNSIKERTDHFTVDFGTDLPKVQGSFQRIEQVVINLLANACQSLPSRDKTISVETYHDPHRSCNVLRIADEGIGISEQDLERITEPFFTTRRTDGGTGLGLSVAMRIIEEHGGQLIFSSREGRGTQVEMLLPVNQAGGSA